ncbi:MAG: peptide chain release factor N(5)-glutamine methyltransferase [Acidimicrobiales bacterium]|nr:peptide chain release factor N(5)-glutamine methyltransferase [Acidimicrobiales bacterium]
MADVTRWRALLAEATKRLADGGYPSAAVEARRIVEQASGFDGPDFVVGLDEPAPRLAILSFERMLERRLAGEPLQYVLGSWGFRTLDLFVDRRVLIPRPETEIVVELALAELDRLRARRSRPIRVADLGTGTGAIALAVVAERPWTEVWATDQSVDALEVARVNLAGVGRPAARVRLAVGSWFEALPEELRGQLDAVVSNPPYVAAGEPLPDEVADWEPTEALVAGPTGLEALEAVISGAPAWLTPEGVLVVEIAPHQAQDVRQLAVAAGFAEVDIAPDLAGRDRVVIARRVPLRA